MDSMKFNGYVYELEESLDSRKWQHASSEAWEVSMVSADDKRAIAELGVRRIDDTLCMVFRCLDGRVRAITMSAARVQR